MYYSTTTTWLMQFNLDTTGNKCRRLMSALDTYTLSEREGWSVYTNHLKLLWKVAGQAKREIWQRVEVKPRVTSSAK